MEGRLSTDCQVPCCHIGARQTQRQIYCMPATLFLNRSLRTRMDLVRPGTLGRVAKKQTAQKVHHDGNPKFRELFVDRM